MESVRGIENPGMMGEMGKIIGFYRLYRQTAEEEWEPGLSAHCAERRSHCRMAQGAAAAAGRAQGGVHGGLRADGVCGGAAGLQQISGGLL